MQDDPVDIRLPASTRRAAPRHQAVAAAALDEAFASVTDKDLRLDTPKETAGDTNATAEAAELSQSLRQQLFALEEQHRKLSRLLSGLDS